MSARPARSAVFGTANRPIAYVDNLSFSGADVVQRMRTVLAHQTSEQESPASEAPPSTAGVDNANSTMSELTQPDARERPSGSPADVQRMTSVLAAARSKSAGIIGVTGTRPGVGVSVISHELAVASAGFGVKTVLVDLSAAVIVEGAAAGLSPSLPGMVEKSPSLFVVRSESAPPQTMMAERLRTALSEFVQSGLVVVIDLPPVLTSKGAISPSIPSLAALCDMVLLVCLAGQTTEKELSACIAASSIVGFKPSGLILNDWQLPASQLITD